jgi:hypothetical protein
MRNDEGRTFLSFVRRLAIVICCLVGWFTSLFHNDFFRRRQVLVRPGAWNPRGKCIQTCSSSSACTNAFEKSMLQVVQCIVMAG